jgi:hypothetical protein
MYGWQFLDDPSLSHDRPARPSLTIDIRSGAGSHSPFWFNECGRDEGGTDAAYCIEGTVTFEDLEVLRGDATPQPLEEFISEGHRYWQQALNGRDERSASRPSELRRNTLVAAVRAERGDGQRLRRRGIQVARGGAA